VRSGRTPAIAKSLTARTASTPSARTLPLVDERAVDEAIGHHVRAAREGRRDDLLDGLRARGREQERLGARADPCVELGSTSSRTRSPTCVAARLAQLLRPRGRAHGQPVRVEARLGGLAGAVDALEADERGGAMPGR